jgi:prepilin-type processing-associated H-X9-DG protein
MFRCPSDRNQLDFDDPNGWNQYPWGKINYKACSGNDIGSMSSNVERNNGVFITNKRIKMSELTDGTSYTAVFAEAVLGDGDDEKISIPGDWFSAGGSAPANTQAAYTACVGAKPATGSSQYSRQGRNWVAGNYIPGRYNHIMPPNTHSCFFASGSGNDPVGSGINEKGCATTASSRHPGGVNLVMADGSTHFAPNAVDYKVWWAIGSRNGKETVSADWDTP